jgi:hypothetical protein
MAGCGSQSSNSSNPIVTNPETVPVSMTVTDTPPANVTVLFFQLNITSALLSPGNVSLLPSTNPIPVNVTQLQTESAFLGSQNVTAGTYSSLVLTFANPELTIFNGSGATIGTGANACANNTVCQLTPTATNLTLTFNTAPFPVTVAANTPLAFKLDIHLDTVIQSDLSVNLAATNGVTISPLPAPSSGTTVTALGSLTGAIQSVNSTTSPNSFTLQTGDGRTFTIDVNSSTTYSNFPSSACSTETLACLATQQIVKVEVSLQTGGTLLASSVAYVQPASQLVVEGNIIRLSTSSGNTVMDMILQKGPPQPATGTALPAFGNRATVTVPTTGVNYKVDSGSFTIPSGLTFTGATNLMVGQLVSVVVAPGTVTAPTGSGSPISITAPAATTFTASDITLEPSQITGGVAAINTGNLTFNLATNANYFVPPAPNATAAPIPAPVTITVDTTSATTFLPLTLSPDTLFGLKLNDVVSVKGWIFSTPTGATTITMAADTVLDRGSITAALF